MIDAVSKITGIQTCLNVSTELVKFEGHSRTKLSDKNPKKSKSMGDEYSRSCPPSLRTDSLNTNYVSDVELLYPTKIESNVNLTIIALMHLLIFNGHINNINTGSLQNLSTLQEAHSLLTALQIVL